MKSKIVYIAVPFSDPSMKVKLERYSMVNKVCAKLMNEGVILFSPVTMGWSIAEATPDGLPTDWKYWQRTCTEMVRACYKIIVVMMPGWESSVGVQAEISLAKEYDLEVEYIDPKDFI